MRRFLTLAMLLLFGLPLLAPLLALASARSGDDGSLPACCRRLGAHHCAMSASDRAALAGLDRHWGIVPEQCPYRALALAPAQRELFTPGAPADALFPCLLTHPCGIAQTECRFRIAREHARGKRGPPSQLHPVVRTV